MRVRLVLTIVAFLSLAAGGQPSPAAAERPSLANAVSTIRIEPVDGPALPMARLIAEAVAEGLNERGVRATVDANSKASHVLKGRVELNRTDPTVPYFALIHWSLADAEGEAVADRTQGVEATQVQWDYGDPRVLRSLGNGASRLFAALIHGEDESEKAAQARRTGVRLEGVRGAPGDGNAALVRAIRTALRSSDMALTEDPRQAAYILKGEVTAATPADGRQKVTIVWTLNTAANEKVGHVTQENTVRPGLLDGRWGRLADAAAVAAVQGLNNLIQGATGVSPSRQPSGPPPTPDLPRVPGRAPPPPG